MKRGMLSEHYPGVDRSVAIDCLAAYRCLAAGATGDLATHRPWTYYKRDERSIAEFQVALKALI